LVPVVPVLLTTHALGLTVTVLVLLSPVKPVWVVVAVLPAHSHLETAVRVVVPVLTVVLVAVQAAPVRLVKVTKVETLFSRTAPVVVAVLAVLVLIVTALAVRV
jgi:hypothetical protein